MQFKDVVGQDKLKTELVSMAKVDEIPHSMLFAGSEGYGTLPLALAFVQYIFCQDKNDLDSCGKCNACEKHKKLIHPDLHISFPIIGSNKISAQFLPTWRETILSNPYVELWDWTQKIGEGNKQININNLECLEKIRLMGLKSFESKYKAWLIWMPEYLGNLGNKLLKLLEEPPLNTFIILVSVKPEQLLGTILSRCQTFRVPPLDHESIISFLKQNNVDDVKTREIARISGGNINVTQSILNQKDQSFGQMFISWLRACYALKSQTIGNEITELAKLNREQLKHFIQYGLYFLRNCLQSYSGIKIDTGDIEETKAILGISRLLNLDKIVKIHDIFEELLHAIERNANPKILFMDSSIKIHKILRAVQQAATKL